MSAASSDQVAEISFQDLHLCDPLIQAIESAGYRTATPIQSASDSALC